MSKAPQRYKDLEQLQAKGRGALAEAVPVWLAPAREVFEKILRMVGDASVSDAEFEDAVAKAAETMPDLWEQLDKVSLATVFENYMGAAMAQGIAAASGNGKEG